jgi:hypothetical protein
MRALALVLVIFAARYFLVPPLWLRPPLPPAVRALLQGPAADAARELAPNLYARHRGWLLAHIAGGSIAMMLGLVQFIASVRSARPAVHRALGTIYLGAVMLASVAGFRIALAMPAAVPADVRSRFMPVTIAFLALSVVWLTVTIAAYRRARQRRFDEHRAWMIRSYSLTFAAVTMRLLAPVFLFLFDDPVTGTTAGLLTWPLNLVVAEWLIRRSGEPVPAAPRAAWPPRSAAPH